MEIIKRSSIISTLPPHHLDNYIIIITFTTQGVGWNNIMAIAKPYFNLYVHVYITNSFFLSHLLIVPADHPQHKSPLKLIYLQNYMMPYVQSMYSFLCAFIIYVYICCRPKERSEADIKMILELIGNFPQMSQLPILVKREIS